MVKMAETKKKLAPMMWIAFMHGDFIIMFFMECNVIMYNATKHIFQLVGIQS